MFTKSNDLISSAISLVTGEKNKVANLANLSALINDEISDLNWVGFYLWDDLDQELILGPFQGKPACIRIKPTRGVCGKAYSSQTTQLVADVNEFKGHIACDISTQSELVIPILQHGKCLGVLDLDSPKKSRFTDDDAKLIGELVRSVTPLIWPEAN